MKRTLILSLAGLIVIGGSAAGAYAYRNQSRTPAPIVQQENVPSAKDIEPITQNSQPSIQPADVGPQLVNSGTFKDIDAVHRGHGTARIVTTADGAFLRLEQDFGVTPGPDLFVYASTNPTSKGLGDFDVIGKLKSFEGEQVYNLPADYQKYKSIVIWCRSFSVTFSTADLQ